MDKKYQVFISSTFKDLEEERDQVYKAILTMGHIPIGMEMFNAGNVDQWEIIKKEISECDYYVLIIANRYGSIEKELGISYTEKEYRYAKEQGVPVIAFLLDQNAGWPASKTDKGEKQVKLDAFKNSVMTNFVNFWSSKESLESGIYKSLANVIRTTAREGWVRGSTGAATEVLNELARLSEENAQLRLEIARIDQDYSLPKIEKKILAHLKQKSNTLSLIVEELHLIKGRENIYHNIKANLTLLESFKHVSRYINMLGYLETGKAIDIWLHVDPVRLQLKTRDKHTQPNDQYSVIHDHFTTSKILSQLVSLGVLKIDSINISSNKTMLAYFLTNTGKNINQAIQLNIIN